WQPGRELVVTGQKPRYESFGRRGRPRGGALSPGRVPPSVPVCVALLGSSLGTVKRRIDSISCPSFCTCRFPLESMTSSSPRAVSGWTTVAVADPVLIVLIVSPPIMSATSELVITGYFSSSITSLVTG